MRAAALVWIAVCAWGAVDGTVINKTTGKPQGGATVTLYKLGGAGMESVESVKSDGAGKFVINRDPQGPHLIQTAFDGVTYNHMLPPEAPRTGLALEVFNSSAKPGDAKVAQHIVLLEPAGGELNVNESIVFANEGKLTFNNPEQGTARFFLPAGAKGKAKVMASAPQGMPVERAAEETGQPNVYKVDFPIKPGETRINVTYALPLGEPPVFASKLLHKEGRVRLVTPAAVTLKGDNLEALGQEPTTKANIWELKSGVTEYQVAVEGAGTLSSPAASEEDGPSIQQILPRVYDRLNLFLGLSLALLAAVFLLLLRRTSPAPPAPPAPAPQAKGKRKG